MTIQIDCQSTKICTKCKKEKLLSEFGNAGRGDSRLRSYCKICAKTYRDSPASRSRMKDSQPKYNANRRAKYDPIKAKYEKILSTYGLTSERYDKMLSAQGGLCLICKQIGNLVVDHDHSCCEGSRSCGRCVRGLLCTSCNNGLGRFRDSVINLENAILYLKSS